MQIVTLLKNDFKKEESRNIDREIVLEKKIKLLDNIVFKRDQSAQTVHMLTKPQSFYDRSTKQALGIQNPFYLKKAWQLDPKLYDESRSKILLKQKDPMVLEKKVNTKPIDYATLNKLSKDFETRFVPQIELSTEQVSCSFSDLIPSNRFTTVEVPSELLKVSMVNTSLQKLKRHLARFDVVVKERTMSTTITNGSWGFKHTKACFRDEIIPFVKALKDLFNTFDQYLIDELTEEQALVIVALKEEFRKLKGKAIVENVVTPPTIALVVHKVDLEALSPKLKNNREAHVDYIRITKENDDTLRAIVKQARTSNPFDNVLAYAFMYTKQIQELAEAVKSTIMKEWKPTDNTSGPAPQRKERCMLQCALSSKEKKSSCILCK
nr:hypothetical protein [Tanacetum cinerariifolium]